MKKCDSYHLQPKTRYTYHPLTGSPIAHDIKVGVCWGTKECDECNCGGDMTQCDFYPYVRERANKEPVGVGEDCLVVTYDCCSSDVPTLCVVRKEGDKVRVLNTIQGDQALYGYAWLTGLATLKERTRRKKKRKYYRKCGVCGERYEQSEMLRTDDSPNGWVCWGCRNIVSLEYDD